MFKIEYKSKISRARIGRLKLPSGEVETPLFLPIATFGNVRGLSFEEIKKIGYQMILANTYHLHLRPGTEIIKKFKSLKNFCGWNGSILTDSGGFQIFSLKNVKVFENFVEFLDEIEGKKHKLSPEKSIEIQLDFKSDILMVLDYFCGWPYKKKEIEKAVSLTTKWAQRSKIFFKEKINFKNHLRPLLFGIIQGGVYKNLREKSLKDLLEIGFDGYAIGGLGVGEGVSKMFEVIDFLVKKIPEEKPRYLMGIGLLDQILKAIKKGIDIFDCVVPTREGRHGRIFVRSQKFKYKIINILNTKYKKDKKPIDSKCNCFVCQNFSRAFLHHLFKTKDPLGLRLASFHNLYFYFEFIEEIKRAIKKGKV